MRTVQFIILVGIAVSLIILSVSITDRAAAIDASKNLDYTPSAQADVLRSDNANTNTQQQVNGWVADRSLSHSMSAVQSNLPIPNDPYLEKQWGLKQINVQGLWQITTGKPDIVVAILDTGIDQSHEDLEGKVVAEVNFTASHTLDDIHGHGTHIAGIIAANSNNSVGIVGLAPESRLLNVKVADDKGRCQALALAEGIVWAVDNGATVINISVELKESLPELEDAVNYAWSQGAIIIAAAGNDGSQLPIYPAYYDNCIAVASTRQDDTLAPLSNYGAWVDVAAPGFNIYSTTPNNNYGYKTGTSFATAYVSGLAALLLDVVIDTNGDGRLNEEVRAAIEAGCQEIGIDGIDIGRIDAANSLAQKGL